jgi:hypothetical protein
MSKKDLEGACLLLHVPEKDGPGYKKKMLTLEELAELLPPCGCKAEAAPTKAPAKKTSKKKE